VKLVSWNVNGIRAAMGKGLREFVEAELPEVLCLQETKAHPEQVNWSWLVDLGYTGVWNSAVKKGYSGTAIFSRVPVNSTSLGMEIGEHDSEGRITTAEFDDFQLVTVYTPNSQRGLARLEYRQQWDTAFAGWLERQRKKKPVIFCGDLNVAVQEIDLANPNSNRRNAGFTDEERDGLTRIADAGFRDSFREFESGGQHYSWWTYRMNCRARNIGWRLDYFFVDDCLWPLVQSAAIRPEIMGSDHCPVELVLRQ
jgi:exodeoxyribonuclease-3